MVLYLDKKTQIQALDRTKPLLPMGLGYVEGVTHDYIRHNTTTLFASMDVATGEVITHCKPRHRHQEFLRLLRQIEKSVPEDLDLHLTVDNYYTHKHAKVRAWMAQRPRFHVHYTPTYASWLNQVERWYGIITQRGWFSSVKALFAKIEQFVEAYNKTKTPFNWTATAEQSSRSSRDFVCKCEGSYLSESFASKLPITGIGDGSFLGLAFTLLLPRPTCTRLNMMGFWHSSRA